MSQSLKQFVIGMKSIFFSTIEPFVTLISRELKMLWKTLKWFSCKTKQRDEIIINGTLLKESMTTLTSQERFKTEKGVFDEFTHRNLFELESRGAFDKLLSPYKIGKESNVFIAQRKYKKCIAKIYRLQNGDF